MKIAFDHQIFNWQSYGGISRYYSELAREFLLQEQEVRVFAGIHRNRHLSVLPSHIVQGRRVDSYPPKSDDLLQIVNRWWSRACAKRWSPDVLHETYYAARASSPDGLPRVATVHDMIHEVFRQLFPENDRTPAWKRATCARVDHIISISHSTKKDLVEILGINPSKITVIHLGVDATGLARQAGTAGDAPNRPYLLYVGARDSYKNFGGLARSLAASDRLRRDFDLVCFGGGALSDAERAAMAGLGFSQHQVRQVAGDDEALARLYRHASAFIYPSLYEGFGLPPLEAMACSCPAVVSNTSSIPEVVGDAGEYFDPREIEDMRYAIERVVYSSSRTLELKTLGANRVKGFCWSTTATRTLNVYRMLAA